MGYITFCFFPEYSMEAMDEKGPARWFFPWVLVIGSWSPGNIPKSSSRHDDHLSIKNDGDLGIP